MASLAEILALKNPVTSIAREIFKKIVPDDQRSVQHWNELSEAVLLKEKLLISKIEIASFIPSSPLRIPHLPRIPGAVLRSFGGRLEESTYQSGRMPSQRPRKAKETEGPGADGDEQ